MLVVLVGYPGSQKIVAASKYLTEKYLTGFPFNIIYLNYKGEIKEWAKYMATFLKYFTDSHLIFALDDYLLADQIGRDYFFALSRIGGDVVCVKLCQSTPEEHAEYPVTTQYCVWDRKYLIELLEKVNTPWEFEIIGSKLFDKKVLHIPCLNYFTNSSISGRWEGIRLDGLKPEDVKHLFDNGFLVPGECTYPPKNISMDFNQQPHTIKEKFI